MKTILALALMLTMMIPAAPAFADEGPITVTGVLLSADAITDEATGTTYELISDSVNVEAYTGQRVTIQGVASEPFLLTVTQITAAPAEGDSPAGDAGDTVPPKELIESEAKVVPEEKPQKPGTMPVDADQTALQEVDHSLGKLKWSNIAFNTPEEMKLGETATIELLLSPSSSIEELKQQIAEAGEKEGAQIRTSNRMQARLTGPGFEIESISPEEQAVSTEETTKWKWDIKTTQAGEDQKLHLTISALIYVEGQTTPRLIEAYDRTINVNVSWEQRTFNFIGKNWQFLWTAILVPIALWGYRRRKEAQRKSNAEDDRFARRPAGYRGKPVVHRSKRRRSRSLIEN